MDETSQSDPTETTELPIKMVTHVLSEAISILIRQTLP